MKLRITFEVGLPSWAPQDIHGDLAQNGATLLQTWGDKCLGKIRRRMDVVGREIDGAAITQGD